MSEHVTPSSANLSHRKNDVELSNSPYAYLKRETRINRMIRELRTGTSEDVFDNRTKKARKTVLQEMTTLYEGNKKERSNNLKHKTDLVDLMKRKHLKVENESIPNPAPSELKTLRLHQFVKHLKHEAKFHTYMKLDSMSFIHEKLGKRVSYMPEVVKVSFIHA